MKNVKYLAVLVLLGGVIGEALIYTVAFIQ